MWSDIYNDNFVDTLLLLSIPGISIALTLVAVLVNALLKRRRRSRPPASIEAALEEAADKAAVGRQQSARAGGQDDE